MKTTAALLVILAIIICVPGSASVPPIINYQGKLLQPSGAPVPDGTYSVQFAIYAAPAGGTPLWSETNPTVQVKGGLFAVLLGSVNNLGPNIFDQPNRFFGVKVGTDPEMTPRQQIASVAYAQVAGNGVPAGAIIMWSGSVASIPPGWALCDGTNNTPDLTARFIVGAGGGESSAPRGGPYAVGAWGGEKSHPLTVAEMPSHNHEAQNSADCGAPNATRAALLSTCNGTKTGFGSTIFFYTGGDPVTHDTVPHENRPPYYALCFIMKLGY